MYRSHKSIECFNADVGDVPQILSHENKDCYLMSDFNKDLLKDEIHSQTTDVLDLIYSYYLVHTILKPTPLTC